MTLVELDGHIQDQVTGMVLASILRIWKVLCPEKASILRTHTERGGTAEALREKGKEKTVRSVTFQKAFYPQLCTALFVSE